MWQRKEKQSIWKITPSLLIKDSLKVTNVTLSDISLAKRYQVAFSTLKGIKEVQSYHIPWRKRTLIIWGPHKVSCIMYLSAQVTSAEYHRLGGWNNRHLFSHDLEAGSQRSRCQRGWVLVKYFYTSLQTATFSLHPHMAERVGVSSSSYKGTSSIRSGLYLMWPYLTLIILLKTLFPIQSLGVLRLQCLNL